VKRSNTTLGAPKKRSTCSLDGGAQKDCTFSRKLNYAHGRSEWYSCIMAFVLLLFPSPSRCLPSRQVCTETRQKTRACADTLPACSWLYLAPTLFRLRVGAGCGCATFSYRAGDDTGPATALISTGEDSREYSLNSILLSDGFLPLTGVVTISRE